MYSMEGKVLPVRWAAPEMLRGETCTMKSDVWSFGKK
jgi:serine/threonine protein kinase